jgi:hypothetical protein
MTELTWQCVGDDEWEFGQVVRGMIREPLGEVYFDEEKDPGWVWFTLLPHPAESPRGRAYSRQQAAREVEQALGVSGPLVVVPP